MIKYRSSLEETVGAVLAPKGFQYEAHEWEYTRRAKYTPDFCYGTLNVEVKGYFRPGDTAKYAAVAKEIREAGETFAFILQNPNKPVRKGAQLTMGEWCDKHEIPWFWTAGELLKWWGL